jgi:hypothetical protein
MPCGGDGDRGADSDSDSDDGKDCDGRNVQNEGGRRVHHTSNLLHSINGNYRQ